MASPSSPSFRTFRAAAWLVALTGLASAGVSAQPGPTNVPASPPVAPSGPVAEEAPPIVVPTPAPIVVPPISPSEVEAVPVEKTEPAVKAVETPVRRPRYDVAVLQAIDKVTAETLRFEAAVGKPVRYKGLIFTVRACERSTPEEGVPDSVAYLTIDSQPRATPGRPAPAARQAFKGWMYASSPGVNPLEHAVYDAWLISCRTAAPSAPTRR